VSPSDPAAQLTGAMRGPAFFAYADNYLVDVKFGIIMDVEASRAIRQAEVGAAKTMIERTEARFNIKPGRLAADSRSLTAGSPGAARRIADDVASCAATHPFRRSCRRAALPQRSAGKINPAKSRLNRSARQEKAPPGKRGELA
jgi:hypothetical protein